MVQFRLRRQQRHHVRSRWARHRRAGPRGPWAGRDAKVAGSLQVNSLRRLLGNLSTKAVGNLQDNSLRRPIGKLSSKVSGNLLHVLEVDIAIQEGNQPCTSRIMGFLNGQEYRRLLSGPAIQRIRVLQTTVAPPDAQSHVLSVAGSARSRWTTTATTRMP